MACEILSTYVLVRWWLVRRGFPGVVEAARLAPAAACDYGDPISVSLRLGVVVQRTLDPIPFDSRCLIRSLVLTRMLARRGIESTFLLGVRAKPEFAAHAWLERGGVALLPTGPEFHRILEV